MKNRLSEFTSAMVCSVENPSPFAAMGRVATAQNSMMFCCVMCSGSPLIRSVFSARAAMWAWGWLG